MPRKGSPCQAGPPRPGAGRSRLGTGRPDRRGSTDHRRLQSSPRGAMSQPAMNTDPTRPLIERPEDAVELHGITLSRSWIAEFCRRHHVRRFALFGSILRDDFGPESDVDVLVEFEPGKTPGLAFFGMQDELSDLVGGRPVDLATVDEINRWIRGPVLREARVLWSQGEGGDPRARYLSTRTGPSPPSRGNTLMDSRDLLYLGHMLDTTRQTQEMLAGIDTERFDNDLMAQLALTRLIEVIGESARRVSPAGRAQLPGI